MTMRSMPRRAFVKGLAKAAPAAALGVAAGAGAYVKQSSGEPIAALRKRVDALKARIDRSDERNRKYLKTALMLAGLSLGLDLTTLL